VVKEADVTEDVEVELEELDNDERSVDGDVEVDVE